MAKIVRFLGNIVIAGVWLYVFDRLGWITFTADGLEWWEALLIVAFITKVIEFVFDWIYLTFILATCGIGCITLPFVMLMQGWIWLLGASKLTGWFTINEPFLWIGLLMSIAYGMIRIPSVTSTTTTSSNVS